MQPAEHDDFTAAGADKGLGGATADAGLGIAIDRDVAQYIVHLLLNLQLDRAVGADERRDFKADADVLGGNRGPVSGADAGADACAVRQVATDDRTGFADKNTAGPVVGSGDVGLGENGHVGLPWRGGETDCGGKIVRSATDHPAGDYGLGDTDAGGSAGEAHQFVGLDPEAEGADAGGGIVAQRDLGNDDLDAHLGEENVDLGHEIVDEPEVVQSAGHDNGIAPFLGQNREQRTELLGGFKGEVESADRRGQRRARGFGACGVNIPNRRPGYGPRLAVRGAAGGVLPGDQLAQDGGHVLGGGVFKVDDLVAGVGIGAHIEPGDQLIEEGVLARVGDEDDLVGAVVGMVGGGGAELLLQRAGEHGAQFGDNLTGLGRLQGVELWLQPRQGRLVEPCNQGFNTLKIADRVGEQRGIAPVENDGRAAGGGIEQAGNLGHELVDPEKFQLEELAGDAAAGWQPQGGAFDELRGLGFRGRQRRDLQEPGAQGRDGDPVQVEQAFDGLDGFLLGDLFPQIQGKGEVGQILRTQQRPAGPTLEQGEHLVQTITGHLNGADKIIRGGGLEVWLGREGKNRSEQQQTTDARTQMPSEGEHHVIGCG